MDRRVLALMISVILPVTSGCLSFEGDDASPPIKIVNAYCDKVGFFNFTLENRRDRTADVEYKWTLNDPKADEPVFEGEGNGTLGPLEYLMVSIPVDFNGTLGDYDPAYLVMYVKVFEDGDKVFEYRRQKSPNDFDYSTLPPTPKD